MLFLIFNSITTEEGYAMEKSNYTIILNKGWYIQSSEKLNVTGAVISSPYFSPKGWFPTIVPSTVLNTLLKNKIYKDIYFGKNLDNLPADPFKKSWWYRTKFVIPNIPDKKIVKLEFDGIIYRANIWLNGKQVTNADNTEGTFRRFEFDISNIAIIGKNNILAVEVIPPKPGEPNVGFVDWNPKPADNSMGLWREVRIKVSGDVSIKFPFVRSDINLETLKSAGLTISDEIQNNSNKKVSGILEGEIDKIIFSKNIDLEPSETKLVNLNPSDYKQLIIENPRLWWTYDLGKPELYNLRLKFKINNRISDISEISFGIRDVRDYFNEKGFRGYKLNGKKILIKGGGWTDDILLDNEYEKLENQVRYVKHMNLNTIRLEGFWGTSEDIYNLCDKYGILIMAGWSCQWEWENLIGKKTDNFGGISTPEEIKLIAQSWKDQIKWLRNHPSIIMWLYGSDLIPRPALEKEYIEILKTDDPTRPFLASAKEHKSTLTGKTAVKMRGPYDYVPPVYWHIDTLYGGAFGFNTETGPGAQVPPLESVKKMIPKDSLWPQNSCWDFHCCRGKFKNLSTYNTALNARYGVSSSVEEYCIKAQAMNYEAIRGMFEAFETNRFSSTGVIQWMLNSAWPKLWWQLYDYYLMPNGAFYGTKKSCEPVHILYNYGTKEICVVNNTAENINNLDATIKVLNLDMSEKFSRGVNFNLLAGETYKLFILPELKDLTKTYFIDLRLFEKNNKIISKNFYWLSTKEETLDWKASNWYVTPIKEYADFTDLNNLLKTKLYIKSQFIKKMDIQEMKVELMNPENKLAFLIELSILKGKNGDSVLPIFWEDNYFSLLPGEKRVIEGYFYQKDLDNLTPILKVSGWNVSE
jgi:exo-1,4-beta-D-glucosaminidase